MLERMRATEEDEEFERAFRSMVRSAYLMSALLHDHTAQHSLAFTSLIPTFLYLPHPRQVHESVQGVRTVGTFKSAGTDRMAIPGEIGMRRPSIDAVDAVTEQAEVFRSYLCCWGYKTETLCRCLSSPLSLTLSLFLYLPLPISFALSLAVLPKPKNVLPSRFRSGSADEEDMLGQDVNDYRCWLPI